MLGLILGGFLTESRNRKKWINCQKCLRSLVVLYCEHNNHTQDFISLLWVLEGMYPEFNNNKYSLQKVHVMKHWLGRPTRECIQKIIILQQFADFMIHKVHRRSIMGTCTAYWLGLPTVNVSVARVRDQLCSSHRSRAAVVKIAI